MNIEADQQSLNISTKTAIDFCNMEVCGKIYANIRMICDMNEVTVDW